MSEEQKPNKWASRKLWVAVGGVLTVIATEWANLSPELTEQIVAAVCIICPAYIAGQSFADGLKEWAAKKK